MDHLAKGDAVECPCCTQLVKKYRYKITRVMAKQLLHLFRKGPAEYVDFENAVDNGRQHKGHYLAKWNLIVLNEDDRRYYLTDDGKAFIRGEIKVPKYIHTFNQQVVATSGPEVAFSECLGEAFDLAEIFASGAETTDDIFA